MPAESDLLQWWDRSITRDEVVNHTTEGLVEAARERIMFEAQVCAAVAQWKRRLGQVHGDALARDKRTARRYGHRLVKACVACGWLPSTESWHELRDNVRQDSAVMQAGAVLRWDEWRIDTAKWLETQLAVTATYVIHHAVGDVQLRRLVSAMARLREELLD